MLKRELFSVQPALSQITGLINKASLIPMTGSLMSFGNAKDVMPENIL